MSVQEREYMQLKHVAVVIISGLVLTGCSLLPGQNQTQPDDQVMESQTEETMLRDESAVDEAVMDKQEAEGDVKMPESELVAVVTANNFSYDVKEIKVKQGEKLTISVTNTEGIHDFIIDELAVNSGMIKVGETVELEIPTDKPGTYEYYCSVGQHRQMGMKGTLIIE